MSHRFIREIHHIVLIYDLSQFTRHFRKKLQIVVECQCHSCHVRNVQRNWTKYSLFNIVITNPFIKEAVQLFINNRSSGVSSSVIIETYNVQCMIDYNGHQDLTSSYISVARYILFQILHVIKRLRFMTKKLEMLIRRVQCRILCFFRGGKYHLVSATSVLSIKVLLNQILIHCT